MVSPPPKRVEGAWTPEAVDEPHPFEPMIQELDLTSALSMAGGQSPQIAYASARYREAYARLAAAQTLWLPSLRIGVVLTITERSTPRSVQTCSSSS